MSRKIFVTIGMVAAFISGLVALQWAANDIGLSRVPQFLAGFSYGGLAGSVVVVVLVNVWKAQK